jgi:hypothetical protein
MGKLINFLINSFIVLFSILYIDKLIVGKTLLRNATLGIFNIDKFGNNALVTCFMISAGLLGLQSLVFYSIFGIELYSKFEYIIVFIMGIPAGIPVQIFLRQNHHKLF